MSAAGTRAATRLRGAALRPTREAGALAAATLTVAATAAYAAAAIYRHEHFGSNAYDLGLFDQTVWGYSRLEVVPNTILRLPTALGDHFHPVLALLAPLYWAWDDPRVLLLAQAFLLALAGVPIYLWARQLLGTTAALLLQAAYLVFWAVLSGDIFDFHELAVAAPIVSFALYALLTERVALLWVTLVLGLLTREDVTLVFLGIAAYTLVVQRRWRLGLALGIVSVAWFAIAIKLLIPALADRPYQQWYYTRLGGGPGSALLHVVAHPLDTLRILVTPREKLTALFNLLAPWLALPLLSPLAIVMLPTLAARFLSDKPSHWAGQGFHYSLLLAPMLAFAAVDGVARLARLLPPRRLELAAAALACAVLLAGLYFTFARLRPLDELGRYATSGQIAAIEECLETIPPDASVAATSALVPHLSHRRRIYVLDGRPTPRTRFLALDASTWIFPLTADDVGALVDRALRRGYGVRCSRRSVVVLERGARSRALSPDVRGLVPSSG